MCFGLKRRDLAVEPLDAGVVALMDALFAAAVTIEEMALEIGAVAGVRIEQGSVVASAVVMRRCTRHPATVA